MELAIPIRRANTPPTYHEVLAAFDRIGWPRKETVQLLAQNWLTHLAYAVWYEVNMHPDSPRLREMRKVLDDARASTQ